MTTSFQFLRIGSGKHLLACLPILLAAFATTGCRDRVPDRTQPKSTYETYIGAVEVGDFEAVHAMLVPTVRSEIDAMYRSTREATALIESSAPEAMRQQLLDGLGPRDLREASSPPAYFAVMVAKSRPKISLSISDRLALRFKGAREVPAGSGNYIITPMSGKTITLIREGDGLLYVAPEGTDRDLLRDAQRRLGRGLDQVNQALSALRQERK